MAFGQQSGPPASHRQVQTLLELLADAGHSDFRDARGPMGFTQRQAGGKFTVDEAQAFIDQLEAAAHEAETGHAPSPGGSSGTASSERARPSGAAASSRAAGQPAAASPARSTAGTTPAPRLKVSRTEKLLADLPDDVLAAELQRRGWIVAEP